MFLHCLSVHLSVCLSGAVLNYSESRMDFDKIFRRRWTWSSGYHDPCPGFVNPGTGRSRTWKTW